MTFTIFLCNIRINLIWEVFLEEREREMGLFSFICGTLLPRLKRPAGLCHGNLIWKSRKLTRSLDPSSLHGAKTTVPDFLPLDFFIYVNHCWIGCLLITIRPSYNWGIWVAQSAQGLTFSFSSGLISESWAWVRAQWGVHLSSSLPLPMPLPPCSLSQGNK